MREGRRFVSDQLASWDLPDLVETAALLTSELLTNSVLHARTAITLTLLRRNGQVDIAVRDGSRFAPRRRRHASDATTGRGLELLDQLAESWEVVPERNGKCIRFTLRVGRDPWANFSDATWADVDL